MFSVRGLRVSVRFRHSLRDCSGVVSETGASDGDNSGQLTRGADQDTQILSLPSELARLVKETKVDSVTNRIPVSKEKMRSRSGDSVVVMVCSQISSKSSVALLFMYFTTLSLSSRQTSANSLGQDSILQVRICGEDSSPEQ